MTMFHVNHCRWLLIPGCGLVWAISLQIRSGWMYGCMNVWFECWNMDFISRGFVKACIGIKILYVWMVWNININFVLGVGLPCQIQYWIYGEFYLTLLAKILPFKMTATCPCSCNRNSIPGCCLVWAISLQIRPE